MILRTRILRAIATAVYFISEALADVGWRIECASDRAQLRAEHARVVVWLSDHRGAGKMSG